MFHGNIRFFVRGGNDLKKTKRKLRCIKKRIYGRRRQTRKDVQTIWIVIGIGLALFNLFFLITNFASSFKQNPSCWEEKQIYYSHEKYVHRSKTLSLDHYIYSSDGQKFNDPYDLSLDEVSSGEILDIQYYRWFSEDFIATIRTSEKVLVSKETALLHQQNLAHSYWIVEIVFAGVFLLIWLPLFIRSRRRYLKLKARYLEQQAYFKNQQP